jgi:hypothetical protein
MPSALFKCLLVLASLFAGSTAMATEEPKFQVLSKSEPFELRQYAPIIVAETWVDGDMDAASSKGFRLIADFIFGNNLAPNPQSSSPSAKIAMTAPVTLEPQSQTGTSGKIAMTAPVTLEPQGASVGNEPTTGANIMAGAKRWRVHFVMPSQYTLAALPKPNNPLVSLREIPGKTWAVLVYTGLNGAARVQEKTDALTQWVTTQGLQTLGVPQLARYDPPWTLPFFRRNEVMVEVAPPK